MDKEEIPQILREVPPEKFRELIEALLGLPMAGSSSGGRNEILDNPTEEERNDNRNIVLGNGRVMTPRQERRLRFSTGWLGREQRSGARSNVGMVTAMYLGAASNSRFKSKGEEKLCKEEWSRMATLAEPLEVPEMDVTEEVKKGLSTGWLIYKVSELIQWFTTE